jgi:hypothetical protein
MRKLTLLLLGILVILSLAGPVYAKSVSSSAGGIGTSHTGAGVGSFEKMAGAGHSAIVQFFMEDTIFGEGATAKGSDSDAGTNAEDLSTVAYNGKITWDASVKGGDGTVSYSTGLQAIADEFPDPYDPMDFWACTEIWSNVKASADGGAVAKGKVTSSGTASATSTWDLGDGRTGSITSTSSGKTSASAEVEEYSSGAAWADLEGYTEVGSYGEYGWLSADIEAGGIMDHGTGEVESSASGTVMGTANALTAGDLILAIDPALSYNGMAVAEGSASGSLETEESVEAAETTTNGYAGRYYTEIDVEGYPYWEEVMPSQEYAMPDYPGGHIFAVGSLSSDQSDYEGSVEAGAQGSGLLSQTYGGWDREWSANMLDSVGGSASVEADLEGYGAAGTEGDGLFAGLYSFPGAMPVMFEYPMWTDYYFGIGDWGTIIQFDEEIDNSAFIGSRADIYADGGSGSAEAAASGKVVNSNTVAIDEMYLQSTQNNVVEGSTKAGASVNDWGYSAGDSLMLARSSIGPEEDTGGWMTRDMFFGYPIIDLEWWTFAGTGAQISSHSEASGPAATASGSAQGTATGGASGLYIYPGDPAFILDFNSAANAAGKVSSEAKSRTYMAEAESTAVILATNAVGEEMFWFQDGGQGDVDAEYYFDDLYSFVSSQHGLLTSAAVWSPDTDGTSTATAKASGSANADGKLVIVNDYSSAPDEVWTVSSTSSGTGTLASDFKAKDGYGLSMAWVHGGNFAGWDYYQYTPEIQSFDYPLAAGITTYASGEAPDTGNIKGTTSVKDGSSMEMAHISYEVQDLFNPEMLNELYSLDTYSLVSDKASSEVSVKKGGGAMANSFVTAWNNAWLDDGTLSGSVDAGYYADAYADAYGTGKAKAQIKPWNIVTSAEYTMVDTSVFPPGWYHDEILYLDSGAESAKFP